MKRIHVYGSVMYLTLSICGLLAQDPVGYPRFMQGPMVGTVTPDSITIWGRLSGAYRGEIELDTSLDFSDPISLALSAERA